MGFMGTCLLSMRLGVTVLKWGLVHVRHLINVPHPSGSVCPGPSLQAVVGTIRKQGSEESDPEGERGLTLSSRASSFLGTGLPSLLRPLTVPFQPDKGADKLTQGHTALWRASRLQIDFHRT